MSSEYNNYNSDDIDLDLESLDSIKNFLKFSYEEYMEKLKIFMPVNIDNKNNEQLGALYRKVINNSQDENLIIKAKGRVSLTKRALATLCTALVITSSALAAGPIIKISNSIEQGNLADEYLSSYTHILDDNTHRTDDNKHFFYDYDEIAEQIKKSNDPEAAFIEVYNGMYENKFEKNEFGTRNIDAVCRALGEANFINYVGNRTEFEEGKTEEKTFEKAVDAFKGVIGQKNKEFAAKLNLTKAQQGQQGQQEQQGETGKTK